MSLNEIFGVLRTFIFQSNTRQKQKNHHWITPGEGLKYLERDIFLARGGSPARGKNLFYSYNMDIKKVLEINELGTNKEVKFAILLL